MTHSAATDAERPTVSLLSDRDPGPAARHGLRKLTAALKARGVGVEPTEAPGRILIVAGLAGGAGPAAKLHKELKVPAPQGAESLVVRRVRWKPKGALLVSGGGDRGLMYALLDVAGRVGWAADAADPLSEVTDAAETPAVAERALSKYTMHRAHFESTFHDPRYWRRYLDMLAECRFNTFVLIFGYENGGYFAPPYPYFFDVEGFDDVRVVGLTQARQRRNLDALNRLIRMAHDRGLSFTAGIWDHIYRGGVQGPTAHARKPTDGLVWGVTPENLVPYTKAALRKFLKLVGDLDAVQFRMHGESGLKPQEMRTFWPDVYRIVNDARPGIRFDARAKNFPDSLIDQAVEMGLNVRITTKYWAEQMGLPFHPTHINRQNQHDRRHGYADLLRYPRRYKMHWRLWSGGTTRVLLWGDSDYVRRFAESTHLYDGEGFEVNEPLATKMQDHPHDEEPFDLLAARYRYCDWEFERYWFFFRLFGRIGYNPDAPPEVWRREFETRFGKGAAPFVERGIQRASRVLPRIVACVFPYRCFPTTRGWPELQPRGADLPSYAKADVSDTEQFLTVYEAAKLHVAGKDSPKTSPQETSRWFARTAAYVLNQVAEAEKRIGGNRNREFDSTMVDLRILANLGRFHSRRLLAALDWASFELAGDLHAFDDAIRREAGAIEAWEAVVAAAGDVYHDDLKFGRRGAGLSGHWKGVLAGLKKSLADLRRKRRSARPPAKGRSRIAHVPVRRAAPGEDLLIRATVSGSGADARVKYRTGRGGYSSLGMERTAPSLYRAAIPGAKVTQGLTYFIEAAGAQSEPVVVTVTRDDAPPVVTHEPIATAPAGRPLSVSAQVRDPSGVKWVRLRYRIVNQTQDYRKLEMLPAGKDGRYRADVPGEHLDGKWDFMYFIEAMDNCGNGAMHPDFETEAPYVVVRLQRGGS